MFVIFLIYWSLELKKQHGVPLYINLIFTYFPIMNNSGKFKEISWTSFCYIIPPYLNSLHDGDLHAYIKSLSSQLLLLAYSVNTNCCPFQSKDYLFQVHNRRNSTKMPHDFVSFFVCNIGKPIVCSISAKENCHNLTKNNHSFEASVTEKYTSLSKSSGIFRQKSFKSTFEKVKSLKKLYYKLTSS